MQIFSSPAVLYFCPQHNRIKIQDPGLRLYNGRISMEKLYGKYNMSFEQIGFVISVINQCTKSYNYVINLLNGDYVISEAAVERFGFPAAKGTDYFKVNEKMVYPEDKPAINKDIEELMAGVKAIHDMKYRWLSAKGEIVWISCRGMVIQDDEGRPSLLLGRIAELGNKAEADDATGLLNDNRLEEQLNVLFHQGRRPEGSLMYIGVDDLRSINELYGHRCGDQVIRNVAECIEEVCAQKGMVYRTEGDGFLIYLPDIEEGEEVVKLYKMLRRSLDAKIENEGFEIMYTVSAGILLAIQNMENFEQMVQYVEFSLKEAKRSGRNTFFVFDQVKYAAFIHRSYLRKKLHKDIKKNFNNFELYYQPIVDGRTHKVSGAEALLRWKGDNGAFVSPAEFIPILEESGHIVPVGRWVLETAIRDCGRWIKHVSDFHVNVNLSYVQLEKSDIAELIGILLYKSCMPAENLTIEITESGYVETGSHFNKFHNKAKSLGCQIAIDDFGSGYSNLRYFNEIEANTIKIDRTFTEKAMGNEYDFSLIRHIVEMAHSMGIKVCIEGVETSEELERLSVLEPDYFQGYYFGRPSSRDNFEMNYLEQEEYRRN